MSSSLDKSKLESSSSFKRSEISWILRDIIGLGFWNAIILFYEKCESIFVTLNSNSVQKFNIWNNKHIKISFYAE